MLQTRLALANVLVQRREYEGALEHLEIAAKIDPLNKTSLFTLAKVKARLGDFEGALP